MHFAEFGVVMMLFLIGLELEPTHFWGMRKYVLGLGSLQVILTTLAAVCALTLTGFSWQASLATGLAYPAFAQVDVFGMGLSLQVQNFNYVNQNQ